LARSYGAQRNFTAGASALEKALALSPGHPDLLADLADMLAMAQNRSLAGRPQALIEDALKTDPTHRKALALAATAAMQQDKTSVALRYWGRLRDTFPPDATDIAQIDAAIASLTNTTQPSQTKTQASVSGTVRASTALKAKLKSATLPPEASLFVVAKAEGGPPMPVAVAKFPAQALLTGEIAFTLDDSAAMSPQLVLSAQRKVNIEARLSFAGTANRSPDDVSVRLSDVSIGAQGLALVLP
ncbi:MAG: hypothetical protein RIR70_349, partial [Pseudomonadota bacterium]